MNRTVVLISLQKDIDVIGLKLLHYHLIANSYDSRLLFMPGYDGESPERGIHASLERFIRDLSPHFIGISLMSTEFRRAGQVSSFLKTRFPSIPIVWGGIHPTIAPESCLEHADFACVGEGENSILDLANALSAGTPPDGIRNLCCMRNGTLRRNPLYPLLGDLSMFSACEHVPRNSFIADRGKIVELDLRTFRKYARYSGTTYNVISSRGCPFSCTYCCNNALSALYAHKKVRFRNLPEVIAEIRSAIAGNPYIEYVNIHDDCFLARSEVEVSAFCEMYAKEVAHPFIVRSIPQFVTHRKIASLKAAGLVWINLGLQSGSDRCCREIYKRNSTSEGFLNAARIIRRCGVMAFYDVIVDNPFETDEDRLETVRTFMEAPKPFYPQLFSLTFYPGTELRERALQEHLLREEEYQSKDYLVRDTTPLNTLTRLAAFLCRPHVRYLARRYRKDKDSQSFRLHLVCAKYLSMAVLEPVAYARLLWFSQDRNLSKILKSLRFYLAVVLWRLRG